MMLPTQVNILGTVYDVSIVALPNNDAGDSNQSLRTIRVDSGLPDDARVETFYHELIHMLMDHQGLSALITEQEAEAFAQGLGVALAYVVAANTLPNMGSTNE